MTTETFASPLNFNPNMTCYFSMYAEDALFGANFDAYSMKWTGASQVNPESIPGCSHGKGHEMGNPECRGSCRNGAHCLCTTVVGRQLLCKVAITPDGASDCNN
jgi:hypothetical protein